MEPNTQLHTEPNMQPIVTMPPAPTSQLPKSKQILKEAWELYKSKFWTLQKLSWLPFGVMIAVALVITMLVGAFILLTGGFGNLERLAGVVFNPLFFVPAVLIGIPLLIALVLFGTWCQIALMYTVGKSDVSLKQALMETRNKILQYYWITILIGFIVLGGFILFIVPGIYLAVALSLTMFVFIFENEKGLNALIKSREYSRGNIGRMLKYALYIFLFILPVYAILILIQNSTKDTSFAVLYDIVSQILSLVFAPFFIAYGYKVYEHIKLQKSSMTFAPTVNTKRKYMAFGILGVLCIPVIIVMTVTLALTSVQQNIRATMERNQQTGGSEVIQIELRE